MLSIKGHFDGQSIVLDEPVELEPGQTVRILVETTHSTTESPKVRRPLAGFAKGMFIIPHDFDDLLVEFATYR